MRLTEIRLAELDVPLKRPFKTALRTVDAIEDVVVEIHTDEGLIGYGEAAPTAVITGESKGGLIAALRDYLAPALIGQPVERLDHLFDVLDHAMVGNSSAKAAVDMALYDLYGQWLGVPVYQLLGGYRDTLETDLTISINSPDEMARDAEEAVKEGYRILKIKLGKDAALDLERLRTVAAAVGPDIRFRLDANQGWQPKEAVRVLDEIAAEDFPVEFVEQPVPAQDFAGLKYVTDNTGLAIMADESLFSPADALRLLQMRAVDLLNIKLMKCGGIHQALRICTLAEIYGVRCMLGCMLESRLSVNAAAHLAAGKQVIEYVDLDGPGLSLSDPVDGGAEFAGPRITLTDRPGMGVLGVRGLRYLD